MAMVFKSGASKGTGLVIGAAAAGVAVAALAVTGLRWSPGGFAEAGHRLSLTQISTSATFSPPPGAPLSFADIFERVAPAVVTIDVTTHVDAKALGMRIPGLPFNVVPKAPKGDDNGDDDGQDAEPDPGTKAQSSGSGFFIRPDGYIVTNNHVVENAEDIKVTLTDGRSLPARVVGRDEATDLAVLKVDGDRYPFVDFENSARPRVGDWVIAVGNPFGLGGTATAGIVSAYGRDIGDSFVDFIQIDAPINRGNSGGPTFDIYGRVIGINSEIFSPSGGSVGIGFAIPADVADGVTKQLIAGGKVTRGYLGATIQNLTPEIADSIGMSGRKGALVAELAPGGPAEKSGVQPGDVVVQLNGHPVASSTELTRLVARTRAGDILHLSVLRSGKPTAIDVRSGVRPSEAQLARNTEGEDDGAGAPKTPKTPHASALGMALGVLDDQARAQLALPSTVHGALVLGVKATSDAADHGLKAGDVIIRAGEASVTGPGDVVAAATRAKKANQSSILLGVSRAGHTHFLPLKIEN